MRVFSSSDSCKESQFNALNPQSWLQVERGKHSRSSSESSSSTESFIKVPEPQVLPLFKPVDYVEVLSRIHEELESCQPHERSSLYLLQFHVFKGLGELKLMQRSIRLAYTNAISIHEKVIFAAWLKYERQGKEIICHLLKSCGKNAKEFGPINIASEVPINVDVVSNKAMNTSRRSNSVFFIIGDEEIECDRHKISCLSEPFNAMLNGCFRESSSQKIDFSKNNISPIGMRLINEFTVMGHFNKVSPELLLEILVFANKFCCERLKDACDRKLASLISSSENALELIEYALEENSPILASSCLQVFLQELPESISDKKVVQLLGHATKQHLFIMVGKASFSLYCLLSEVAMRLDLRSDISVLFLEKLIESAENDRERVIAYHQLGCVRLLRKENIEAKKLFEKGFKQGHTYSIVGLARLNYIKGHKQKSYENLNSVISSVNPLGWMYQERSLYCDGDKKMKDLEKATELDPTLTYPYMYRAAYFMKKQNVESALEEVNRVLGFKLALECLELRCCIYLSLENYNAALCDLQAILTLSPSYRMFEGKVVCTQLRMLVGEHVENPNKGDCWLELYDKWSSVDDIGSLSVIYQMLESDAAKGVLYFRQSLLLLRLNCPEAAMRSLQLARQHASCDYERLVYEGWILYDTGHFEEGLKKAEESIKLKRSFEAFFLKAYALADSSQDPSSSTIVISLLEDALKCPSDRLRKGQALNNLGSVYVDCENLDLAADCYINALKIRHTRAHQGLARVYYLRNDKKAACEEMTKLVEKAKNNASAYEKRSEYCERELAKADLEMVTRLDPLRVYPYRYRAAVLMDNHKEQEAIAELSRAISFKPDLNLLHLRAAFHEHIGDVLGALRDCRAALSVDPTHQEMLELHTRVNSLEP